MKHAMILASLVLVSAPAVGSQGDHSPYKDEATRAIKSLSEEDVAELKRGGGWGLAKPAELNGVPGPAHVLELKEALTLTDAQVAAVTSVHQQMQAKAITEGEKLIQLEQALDQRFQDKSMTEALLRKQLKEIAMVKSNLRFTHLSAHLETLPILSAEQVQRYAVLRGYSAASCDEPPKGHDPALWRKHNGC